MRHLPRLAAPGNAADRAGRDDAVAEGEPDAAARAGFTCGSGCSRLELLVNSSRELRKICTTGKLDRDESERRGREQERESRGRCERVNDAADSNTEC